MSFLNRHQLISYLKYYTAAKTIHSAHSPFLYSFLRETLENKKRYYAYNDLDHLRRLLALRKDMITVTDLGVGSRKLKTNKRSISDILKTSVSGENQSKVLFNIARHMQPGRILELGTSLGFSTLNLSKGYPAATVHTIEGDPAIHAIARQNFDIYAPNIHSICGSFDSVLPKLLASGEAIDLVFVDGNHSYDATMRYHELIKKQVSARGIMIYDDIHWSSGMTQAWHEIIQDEDFDITIDCYYYGILIKHPEATKEHFTIIQKRYKPWALGVMG